MESITNLFKSKAAKQDKEEEKVPLADVVLYP